MTAAPPELRDALPLPPLPAEPVDHQLRDSAIRDARELAREANERAATYRAALIEVRDLAHKDSDAWKLINRVLLPPANKEAEPRVWLSVHGDAPGLRAHLDATCAMNSRANYLPQRVAAFVARMAAAEPCQQCNAETT